MTKEQIITTLKRGLSLKARSGIDFDSSVVTRSIFNDYTVYSLSIKKDTIFTLRISKKRNFAQIESFGKEFNQLNAIRYLEDISAVDSRRTEEQIEAARASYRKYRYANVEKSREYSRNYYNRKKIERIAAILK
jgi:hypothetical protein